MHACKATTSRETVNQNSVVAHVTDAITRGYTLALNVKQEVKGSKSFEKKIPQADTDPREGTSGQISLAETSTTSNSFATNATTQSVNIFLSTVMLIIVDKFGKEHLARALLDSI